MAHGLELIEIADRLDRLNAEFEGDEGIQAGLRRIGATCERIGRSWSGSNLGYQSTVYYDGFAQPPAGARFSIEAGLADNWALEGSTGEWREYRYDVVIAEIHRQSGNPNLSKAETWSQNAAQIIKDEQQAIASVLSIYLNDHKDAFLSEAKHKASEERLLTEQDAARALLPRGQILTRDRIALQQGLRLAPHQAVLVKAALLGAPAVIARNLAEIARQAGSHLARVEKGKRKLDMVGTNVFIGHGRSLLWRSLQNFVEARLRLPHDEFNRVPVAGVTNIARLSEMLDAAAVAFIILTAEDELKDGKHQARMNVIHEAGLFQGRLGFTRAVVMLEEGCEEFSNIQGLGQIRFPAGNIEASFEEVRRVLEREGLLDRS